MKIKKKKKKGYTLIELLAIIIILAIIAVIAVFSITGIINDVKEKAFSTTCDIVVNTVNEYEQYQMLKGSINVCSIFEFSSNREDFVVVDGLKYEPIKNLNLKMKSKLNGYAKICNEKLEVAIDDSNYTCFTDGNNKEIYKGTISDNNSAGLKIEYTVSGSKVDLVFTDNIGIVGYAIIDVDEEPTEWTEIEETLKYETSMDMEKAGTYYIYVKGKFNRVKKDSFNIDQIAFSYAAIKTTSSYTATGSEQCTSYGACCPDASGCPYSCDKNGGCSGACYCNCNSTTCFPTATCCTSSSMVYSCPSGGTLSGTTCTVTTYTCPNGGTLDGTTCKF